MKSSFSLPLQGEADPLYQISTKQSLEAQEELLHHSRSIIICYNYKETCYRLRSEVQIEGSVRAMSEEMPA